VQTACLQSVDQPIGTQLWPFCCHVRIMWYYMVWAVHATLISFWNSSTVNIYPFIYSFLIGNFIFTIILIIIVSYIASSYIISYWTSNHFLSDYQWGEEEETLSAVTTTRKSTASMVRFILLSFDNFHQECRWLFRIWILCVVVFSGQADPRDQGFSSDGS
jgi:hypothetical protein